MTAYDVNLTNLAPVEREVALQEMFVASVVRRQMKQIKKLVKLGLPVNKEIDVMGWGATPLALAVSIGNRNEPGHSEFVCRLIDYLVKEAKADIDCESGGVGNPLELAAFSGLEKISIHLVNCGADINHTGRDGHSILHAAIAQQMTQLVRLCLAKGVDVNHKDGGGNTPLCYAQTQSDIALLLTHGADCCMRNYDDKLPEDVIAMDDSELGGWLTQYRLDMERAELAAVVPAAVEVARPRARM